MRKTFTYLLATAMTAMAAMTASAQETPATGDRETEKRIGSLENEAARLKRLQISGYIQGQYQWGEELALLKVGTLNENPGHSFSRLGIRRGRIKFAYEQGIASAVFQLDITEKGVGLKDAYISLKDPWIKSMSLKAGVFDRPFGYEISYSSSRRESPERSTIFQTLFPDERDLGAMLTLQAPKSSAWSILKLEAGLFAGNGIRQESDSRRDFIGHLSAAGEWRKVSFGAGVSYYNGKVYQATQNVNTIVGDGFVLNDDPANQGKFAGREYVGFDARTEFKSVTGVTRLTAEYIFGRQPGRANSSKSPNASALPAGDTYLRDFSGGYVMLVHDIARTPVAIVAKYDWYDPNTKITGKRIGIDGTTNEFDLAQSTFGLGALWNLNSAIRLTAYYEFNKTEIAENLADWDKSVSNDIFTLRLQYKF
jgi:phosphate-selective porin